MQLALRTRIIAGYYLVWPSSNLGHVKEFQVIAQKGRTNTEIGTGIDLISYVADS